MMGVIEAIGFIRVIAVIAAIEEIGVIGVPGIRWRADAQGVKGRCFCVSFCILCFACVSFLFVVFAPGKTT